MRDTKPDPANSTLQVTVPTAFVQRMLAGARRHLTSAQLAAALRSAGIAPDLLNVATTRVTRAQFSRLYGYLALAMEDEMLGLWSRPIRSGTLKYLGLNLLDAPSLLVALYRFTRFWNLLLDDYRLELQRHDRIVTIRLSRRQSSPRINVFGHELMVKLIHGTASWLIGEKLSVDSVGFMFSQPRDFREYAALFPEQVEFDQPHTFIRFTETALQRPFRRTKAELLQFVRKAPDDWMFLALDYTSLAQRVRQFVAARIRDDPTLAHAALSLRQSTRSLSRRLALEGQTYRAIKEAARRDLSIERLVKTQDPVAQIAEDVGFENLSAFHRAFRIWTGSTPRSYRRQQRLLGKTDSR